ncbi:hypothetical protein GCM10009733_104960 [Nonomuraea maheshkhaliensis]|uniref:Chitin-binding type-3 domain-containing protein n=1 Tax=Nonomuraea maheshkhaliensis TaxID=419590 RepID=A0ABN2HR79_9ACTN
MSARHQLTGLLTAALASAAFLAPVAVPAAAAAPVTGVRAALSGLTCDDFREGTHVGVARCTNHTQDWWEFRAVITCGWAADVKGSWETLPPGATKESRGQCGGGSGVGAIGTDKRNLST